MKIFDSLTHPTLSGEFLGIAGCHFGEVSQALRESEIYRSCAVGMSGIGGYDHVAFIQQCRRYPEFVPVGGFDFRDPDVRSQVELIKELGYQAVKVHPRFAGRGFGKARLRIALEEIERCELPVFLCTYNFFDLSQTGELLTFESTCEALLGLSRLKVVFLHGGGVDLLRYAELVRANDNYLLDLSLTLCKYPGSSVDLDIAFLFQYFDRRTCVGADYPDFDYATFRERVEYFASSVDREKAARVTHRNLESLFGDP
jgi:predicted TIM-barrel fold metal-dependent hydrolase